MKIPIVKIFILLTMSMIAYPSIAQIKGNINGKIKTVEGKPIVLADIILKGTSKGSTTDSSGNFEIYNVSPGDYIIKVSRIGYGSRELSIKVLKDSTTVIPDIILTERPGELQEVIIEDDRPGKFKNSESEYISKLQVRNLENPQAYSTSSEELIKEQNIIDFPSALRSIPGGVVTSENSIGVLYSYIRGFQVLSYIRNGLYSLSPNGGDIQNMEKIEIIKGPSSTVFGKGGVSYGGLINIVTKKPLREKFISGGISFGSFNLQKFTTDINLPLNEDKTFLFRVNGAINSEGTFQDYGHKKNYMIAPDFYSKINDRMDILLEAEINSIDLSPQSYLNGTAGINIHNLNQLKLDYSKSYSSDKIENPPSISSNYDGRINYVLSNNWSTDFDFSLADFSLRGTVLLLNIANDSLLTREFYDYYGQYNTINLQQNLKGDFLIGSLRNRLLLGIDYKKVEATIGGGIVITADSIDYRKNNISILNVEKLRSKYDINLSRHEGGNVYSVYFLDFINITNFLDIMGGLRYEHYDYNGNRDLISGQDITNPYKQGYTAPQAGINYILLKNAVSVFVNFMEGYNFVPPNSSGQTFHPEHAVQVEGGLKTDLYDGKISSTISYYYISVRDKVRPDRNNPPFSIQNGTQKSEGVDTDIRINPFKGLNFILGYSYNDSRITRASAAIEGKRPLGAPQNTINFWSAYTFNKLFKGLGIGAGFIYADKFYYDDKNSIIIPSSLLINGSCFYNFEGYRITLSMDNITNKKHWDFNAIPQPLRRINLSLQVVI